MRSASKGTQRKEKGLQDQVLEHSTLSCQPAKESEEEQLVTSEEDLEFQEDTEASEEKAVWMREWSTLECCWEVEKIRTEKWHLDLAANGDLVEGSLSGMEESLNGVDWEDAKWGNRSKEGL